MAKDKELCVAFFLHPGREHQPTEEELESGIFGWNEGAHARKFMKAEGQTVTLTPTDAVASDPQPLLFWGEWEPTSLILEDFTEKGAVRIPPRFPHYLHRPVLGPKWPIHRASDAKSGCQKRKCCQNTDPFVFNDHFFYALCQQTRLYQTKNGKAERRPTAMQRLDAGSIILFGSQRKKPSEKPKGDYRFMLDTVLVVGKSIPFTPKSIRQDLKEYVTEDYLKVMGWEHSKDKTRLTFHVGATVGEREDGMFSFVPCQPKAERGFPRPELTQDLVNEFGGITYKCGKKQGFARVVVEPERAVTFWKNLTAWLKDGGYQLGIDFKYYPYKK